MKRFFTWLSKLWTDLLAAIVEAREGPKPRNRALDAELGTPVTLVLPASDPLVTSRATGGESNPLPLSHMPIRSTKADAKRAAHEYAEKRAGRALSWKSARKLLNQWERLERETDRRVAANEKARGEVNTFAGMVR